MTLEDFMSRRKNGMKKSCHAPNISKAKVIGKNDSMHLLFLAISCQLGEKTMSEVCFANLAGNILPNSGSLVETYIGKHHHNWMKFRPKPL